MGSVIGASPAKRRLGVAGVAAPGNIVRGSVQPIRCRCGVAGLAASTFVRTILQPAHR